MKHVLKGIIGEVGDDNGSPAVVVHRESGVVQGDTHRLFAFYPGREAVQAFARHLYGPVRITIATDDPTAALFAAARECLGDLRSMSARTVNDDRRDELDKIIAALAAVVEAPQ